MFYISIIVLLLVLFTNIKKIELFKKPPNNLLVIKKTLDRFINILSEINEYKTFALECRNIVLIESTQGALTIDYNVIQICSKHIEELNEIIFVLIHELTHIYLKSEKHDHIFYRQFRKLLSIAVQNQVYIYNDYSKKPGKFCGKPFFHPKIY